MTTRAHETISVEDAAAIAADAYVFGYPLVLMDVTRRVMTSVPAPDDRGRAPRNRFGHIRTFPDATFKDIVSPNADTLYSTAWLDLSTEPLVLELPEMEDRYYLMQMMDAWTNVFASPGTRTTGNGRQRIAIVGPTWRGRLPEELLEIRSPTSLAWILGRTKTNGKDDYAAVNAIQDQYELTPFSAWKDGKRVSKSGDDDGIEWSTPPPEQIQRMSPGAFFSRMNALMAANPPAIADEASMRRFAAIGVSPGRPFDVRGMGSVIMHGIQRGARAGLEHISIDARRPHGRIVNGWDVMTNLGQYGTDYIFRAVVALLGLGANLPDDAIYPRAVADGDGDPLHGANRYALRFPKHATPPVRAFWSLTMYDEKQAFVANPIDRYAIGDRDPLVYDRDGSLTLHLQNDAPTGDRKANWLPTPRGPFNVLLRLYWPERSAVDGSWEIPPIERIG
jgi:hypothetical protein